MATIAEFQAFWDAHSLASESFDDYFNALDARFPAEADRRAYYEWRLQDQEAGSTEETTPISREDLKNMIATMNYNSATDRGKLVSVIQRSVVPWLPVGKDHLGQFYRILPGADGLLADQQRPKTDRELVSTNVLGVNTNVQPRRPPGSRQAKLPDESTRCNESDDSDLGGFVFHQIGILQTWGDEPEAMRNTQDAAEREWLNTDFCVVMRFGRNGIANGLYLIFDFYSPDENGCRDWKASDNNWGWMLDWNEQICMAKLADDIHELSFGRMLNLTERLDYPVEIVRAVKTAENTIMRATIAE